LCKERQNECDALLMVEIDKKVLDLDKHIILSVAYIPPYGTRFTNIDLFDEISNDLLNYDSDTYEQLMYGDFNAHTAQHTDMTIIDDNICNALDLDINTRKMLDIQRTMIDLDLYIDRQSVDKSSDTGNYGREFLNMCKNNMLCIFNGRCGKDRIGKATTTHNTLIDYMIGTPKLMSRTKEFEVLDFDPIYSDKHMRIKLCIYGDVQTGYSESEVEDITIGNNAENSQVEVIGKWEEQESNKFIQNLDKDLINNVLNNESRMCVQEITTKVNTILLDSAKATFGTIKQVRKKNNRKSMYGYNKECRVKRQEYHKAKQRHNKLKSVESHDILKQKSKLYKKELSKSRADGKKEFIKKLRSLKNANPKLYWRMLQGSKKRNAVPMNLQDMFDYFKDMLGNNHENNEIEQEVTADVEYRTVHTYNSDSLNSEFTEQEIQHCIKNLGNNKAAGVDNILNEYIKASADVLLPIYVILFNKILNSGNMPKEWIIGMIVPIYKMKGDIQDPSNYRGITLLSCMGKLFTSVLNKRITNFCETNEILHENQTGFRKGYSTIDHVFLLKFIMDAVKKSKHKLYCAFIDYRKAFDCVWRNGLWVKLVRSGVTGKIFDVIKYMYQEVQSCVFKDGEKSEFFLSLKGVRQGDNLSPLLFALFVNDFEDFLIKNNCTHIDMYDDILNNYIKLFVLMYADDTLVMANTPHELQRALYLVERYCKKWKLDINCTKTKIIVFGEDVKDQSNYDFKYKGEKIDIVNNFKYLGVTFSCNNSFKECIVDLKAQANRAMFSLIAKSRKLQLPIDVQLELFDATVLPILLYGSEVWGFEKQIEECEIFHRKFIKYILKLRKNTCNAMVYGESGRYPILIQIKKKMIGYWARLLVGKQSKLSKCFYDCVFNQAETKHFKWIVCIKGILNDCGLTYVWNDQQDIFKEGNFRCCNWITKTVEQRLRDQFIQSWRADLDRHSSCSFYKSYKQKFEFEKYLISLPDANRLAFSKFRTSNTRLPVVVGKFKQKNNIIIPRENRLCKLCTLEDIGDEYHLLFKCTATKIVKYRMQYIKTISHRPSMYNLINLLRQADHNVIFSISQFLKMSLPLL